MLFDEVVLKRLYKIIVQLYHKNVLTMEWNNKLQLKTYPVRFTLFARYYRRKTYPI